MNIQLNPPTKRNYEMKQSSYNGSSLGLTAFTRASYPKLGTIQIKEVSLSGQNINTWPLLYEGFISF